jgi:hemerythrin-like metal-binding protein
MKLLTWDNDYSVRNEELDTHHKILFDIFNQLYVAGTDSIYFKIFNEILTELDTYSKYHFKTEERYMQDVSFNDIERHRCLHKYFVSRVDDIKTRNNDGNTEGCSELIFFLGNWLKHHVIEEDKRIAP